ncbi:MAG: hypothetical protein ABI112_08215 [Terracoccus sp.]
MSGEDRARGVAQGADSTGRPDVHRRIQQAIDDQIHALGTMALVAGPGCRDRSATAVEQLLTSLRADRMLLREHWPIGGSPISSSLSEPASSRGCGQPQPCPHALDLARKYHVKLR